MRGVFEDEEFERGRQRHETELTLSSGTLLAIFFGLVLLCGVFFGLGFAVGRYGPGEPAATGQKGDGATPPVLATGTGRPKPSAIPQSNPEPQRAVVSVPVTETPAPAAAPATQTPEPASAQSVQTYPSHPAVKPALPPEQPAQPPARTLQVVPSVAPALAVMVQIAAVSHQEDAEVLVSALRRRGYAVTVRRLPSDNLLHVQIGPFANHHDAYVTQQKLLGDGYNAIVE
jgi:cell division septation protein DedD